MVCWKNFYHSQNGFFPKSSNFQSRTFPWVILPTNNGTTNPGIVANVFVIATSVPAKFGAMSMWFARKPQYIPPMQVMPTVMRNTAKTRLQPTYETPNRQHRGMKDAAKNDTSLKNSFAFSRPWKILPLTYKRPNLSRNRHRDPSFNLHYGEQFAEYHREEPHAEERQGSENSVLKDE